MTVSSNLNVFLNKKVENYNPATGIVNPESVVYRVSVGYDDEETMTDKLDAFVTDPKAGEVKELIIGMFSDDASDDTKDLTDLLVSMKTTLTNLRAIFIGDMTYEECEISWIQQSDMTPLLNAYPDLTHFQVRGGEGLRFTNLRHHSLKTLIVETGGLHPETVADIMNAELPQLENLSLWLGSDSYGFASKVSDFDPILSGATFPNLLQLGLMNSELQDEIAIAVAQSSILKQLDVLDLSMGILSDAGGRALLQSPHLKSLSYLNLRHHFLSDEVMQQLKATGLNINLDDQEDGEDEDDRYIEVSE